MSIDKKKLFRTILLGSTAAAVSGVAFGASGVAFAQDDDEDDEDTEVVFVTSSRIPRQDLVANSPVAVVGAEEIALTGQVKVGELLNDLPQVVPGLSSVNNNPSGAINTIDLRGLGFNRTLVLVNGRRWIPATLGGISDMNTIPTGMIERVDVVTGGASSTYGSDAIAGVINFVLKDDFEGLSTTAQYSLQSKGDGDQIYVDATMGANFADGRGNVMINVSWFKQNPIFQGDRAFTSVSCFTTGPSSPTSPFGPFGAASPCGAYDGSGAATGVTARPGSPSLGVIALGSSRQSQGRLDGILGSAIGAPGLVRSLSFNNSGTTAHAFFGPITFATPPGPATTIDLHNYAPPNYLQLPITRTTMNLQGHYDINDDVEFFMSASFVNSDIATRLAPVPATTNVNLHTTNPFFAGITIGDNGATLLQALVDSACALQQTNTTGAFANPNAFCNTTTVTATLTNGTGMIVTTGGTAMAPSTVQATVTAAGNTLTGLFGTSQFVNAGTNLNSFTGTTAQNWLAANNNGNMAFNARRRMVEVGAREAPSDMDTYQFTVGFRGQFANGWNWDTFYQYAKFRRQFSVRNDVNAIRFKQAIDARTDGNGNSVCGPIPNGQSPLGTATSGPCVPLNIFGAGSITPNMATFIRLDATQETEFEREMFGFNLQGTVAELPAGPLGFAVGVEARRESGRFSPDDAFSNGLSLGFNATQPTRGRINVWEAYAETLIPLISEKAFAKYLAVEAGIRWSKYNTVGTVWTWKLGGEWRPFTDLKIRGMFQRSVRAPNIAELFGGIQQGFPPFGDPCNGTFSTGTATGAACLAWGVPLSLVTGGFTQTDGQVQAAFSSNPNLSEETSNSWNVGGVFTPHQIPNLEIIIDYYSITIKGGVGGAFGGTNGTIGACFTALLGNPGNLASTLACQRTPRDAIGQLGAIKTPVINSLQNLSLIQTRGLDVAVRYNFDLEDVIGIPGTIDFDGLFTHVFSLGIATLPGSPVSNFAGTFSFFAGGNIPKNKVAARATYRKGAYSLSLRWTMVGNMTCAGAPSCFTNNTGRRHVLDVTFNWDINDTIGLTLGVENVLAAKPVFLAGYGVDDNTDPSVFNAQLLGPRFFASVRANF